MIWNNERSNPQGNCDLQTQTEEKERTFITFTLKIGFFSSVDGVGRGFVVPPEIGWWGVDTAYCRKRKGERKGEEREGSKNLF